MTAVKEHFTHHRSYILRCAAAVLVLVIGLVLDVVVLAAIGGIACAAMCVWMILWMMARAGRQEPASGQRGGTASSVGGPNQEGVGKATDPRGSR